MITCLKHCYKSILECHLQKRCFFLCHRIHDKKLKSFSSKFTDHQLVTTSQTVNVE